MAYWVYSPEALPNTELRGKPGYNPECFQWNGVRLPLVAGWQKFQETFFVHRRESWRDRPKRDTILMDDSEDDQGRNVKGLATMLKERFGNRGVVVCEKEPQPSEKLKLEQQAQEANLAFRMRFIEQYEERLKKRAVGELVPTEVTAYEDQCYDVLGLVKPYSVEAMRATRHPGEAVGEQIVAALDRLLARREAERAPAPQPAH